MSRLVLHIGTHKTATTSIQKFLRKNQSALSERGVFYPDYGMLGLKPHYAHLGMVNALSGQHEQFSIDQARAFFTEVRARAADYDVTVISAEPFYRHLSPGPKVPSDPDAYWSQRRAYIREIRDLFGEAEIAVVFRQQADYAHSLYQEQVKVTRYRNTFKTFLKEFWFHFDFLGQAEAWAEAFPAPTVLAFERLRSAGDITGAFCTALGIDAMDLPRPPYQNEGLLPDSVILKRILHRSTHGRDEIRQRIERLEAQIPNDLRRQLAQRSFFDGPRKMQEFQDSFAEDNAALARYVPDLTPGEDLFPGTGGQERVFGDKLDPAFLDFLSASAADIEETA